MELVIVTGLSGAGKSKAIEALEDISFYCIDNMPPELIHNFVDICRRTKINRIALVVDIRGGILFESFIDQLKKISTSGIQYKILFLDADDDTIIDRYKETRRKHPLINEKYQTITEAINAERNKLDFLKITSSFVINTSNMSTVQLKEKINSIFLSEIKNGMVINCISFGFKNGLPHESDTVFDVRFLPNPFYIPALKYRTGLEKCVQDYVMKWKEAQTFKNKLLDIIDFLIPLYKNEGKSHLVISIGCTGGKHRSVTFVELLSKHLINLDNKVFVTHRDIDKQ
mgnify:CR=1 FL=1